MDSPLLQPVDCSLPKQEHHRRIYTMAEVRTALEKNDYNIVDTSRFLGIVLPSVMRDARRMGLYFKNKQRIGEGPNRTFLFDLDEIVKRRKAGEKITDIASKLGCSTTLIYMRFYQAGRSLKDEVRAP